MENVESSRIRVYDMRRSIEFLTEFYFEIGQL